MADLDTHTTQIYNYINVIKVKKKRRGIFWRVCNEYCIGYVKREHKKEDREKKQDLNNGNMKENTFESNSKWSSCHDSWTNKESHTHWKSCNGISTCYDFWLQSHEQTCHNKHAKEEAKHANQLVSPLSLYISSVNHISLCESSFIITTTTNHISSHHKLAKKLS